MKENDNDIAIVGMSVFCPGANNIHDFWENISKGVDSIIEAPDHIIDHEYFSEHDDSIDRFYCRKGGFSSPIKIDPLRYGILPVTAEGMDPEHLLMLGGVEQALFDANVFQKNISLKKGCVILGKGNFAGLIALRSAEVIRNSQLLVGLIRSVLPNIPEEEIQKIKKEYQVMQGRYQADTAIGTMPNLVASMVANKFDIQGPAYTVDAACASGLLAVDQAINLLNSGQCDIAIAGGMHTIQSPMFWSAFTMMGALSKKEMIAPFSKDADGLLIGQGGGMIILKKLDKAIEDKDRIYAVIKGTAVCSDGGGSHVMVTSVQGQVRALELAWEKSGLDPDKIGYIEAHGTGTPVGDKTEIATLTEFFGDSLKSKALVGSVKSNIGHTMAAAGMIGLIKTALALYYKKIPPTLHCKEPLKAMYNSRFSPPQELIDWEESEYPLVAGVNAFGFGGINSHAVLTAYNNRDSDIITTQSKAPEPAIVLTAKSKKELLEKLINKDNSITEGNYRLVVFNPTETKIKLAESIIKKGETSIDKQDIWFSGNPVLSKGGKVAFVFPGFEMYASTETDTLSEVLNIPKVDYQGIDTAYSKEKQINKVSKKIESQGTKLFYNYLVNDHALKKLGIVPDMYAGFSIGEWYALVSSGIVRDDSIHNIMAALDIDRTVNEEKYIFSVACGYQKLKPLSEGISNLYLSIDCSPDNVLMCTDSQSKDEFEAVLKENYILYYILPFNSGFHTPFMDNSIDNFYNSCKKIEIVQEHIPVWSGSSIDRFSTDKEEVIQLIVDNVNKPLYFNGIIKKLYEEQDARIFIQIGAGGTLEYINSILKGKEFFIISSAIPIRSGIEQLRRVLALLFVQGKPLDYNFLHVLGVSVENQILRNEYILPQGAPVIKVFPLLKEAVKKYYSHGAFSLNSISKETKHPAMLRMNDNIQEINNTFQEVLSVQDEMISLFGRVGYLNQGFQFKDQKLIPKVIEDSNPLDFDEKISLKLEEHPYLLDHSIIRQPDNWRYQEDLNPIVPLTMTLELFAEIACRHVPSRKMVKIGPAVIMKWMSVEKPFEQVVKGTWKDDNTVVMEIIGFAKIEITFAADFPSVPEEYKVPIDIGKEIMPPISVEEVYNKYTFHGPAYHSISKIEKIAERGILCHTKKTEGKGSLLDSFGQVLGFFLHLTEKENMISFPVKVKEIQFYQDIFDQEGTFEQSTVIKSISSNFEIGDVILKRDGKLWAVAKAWIGQRFPFDVNIWNVILKPGKFQLSQKLTENICFYNNRYRSKENWMFLCSRYLNYPEKQYFESLTTHQQKEEYLTSRIVLKDAVNSFILKEGEDYRFPVEIFVKDDENSRLSLSGFKELESLEVSLAIKDQEVVAIVSNKSVGIGIGFIEKYSNEFMKTIYSTKELKLIKSINSEERNAQFQAAKEAYCKMLWIGSDIEQKQVEIEKIEDEIIFIKGAKIKTIKHKDNYIIAYTL